MSFFYLAPLFGLGILLFLGAIVYVSSGGDKTKIAESENDIIVSRDTDISEDEPETNVRAEKTPRPTIEKSGNSNSTLNSTPAPDDSPTPMAKNLPDTVKIEQNSTAFLRRIAQNDPKAFLTSERAQIVDAKIKQLRGSSALADNIKSAKAGAAQIQALATAKNMKPQFLAVAALTKLGDNSLQIMSKYRKIVWNEGMLLTPHHFQQWDNYYEELLNSRVRSVLPFEYGVWICKSTTKQSPTAIFN
jgi:hypothetical protein